MPSLRGILKKKEKIQDQQEKQAETAQYPDFTILRSTTGFQEEYADHNARSRESRPPPNFSRPHTGYRESTNVPSAQDDDHGNRTLQKTDLPTSPEKKRLSLFHRSGRSRAKSDAANERINEKVGAAPPPVPTISVDGSIDQEERTQQEAKWEKRATMLATNNSLLDSQSQRSVSRDRSPSISNEQSDTNIQEAIRLHEAGDLTTSTRMFGRLADPNGANNALSQVLYGLALRHGWGIEIDTQRGIHYLSLAAANSANIEQQALASGMKKGGAAKGELVLAIFELANCFRNGWGVEKDAAAARQYYETAANLGDTDAMEEAAWCYLEGFGGPKDKVSRDAVVGSPWVAVAASRCCSGRQCDPE